MRKVKAWEGFSLKAVKYLLLVAMLILTVAVAVSGADESYYDKQIDYFGSGGVRVVSPLSGLSNVSVSSVPSTSVVTAMVVYDGKLWVGNDVGAVYYSLDGVSWSSTASLGQAYIYDMIVHNNQLFVSTGNTGRVCNTTSGVSWTCKDARDSNLDYSLTSNGSRLYVSGDHDKKIKYSDDNGLSYSACTDLPVNNHDIYEVYAFNGRLWVGTGIGNIYYSDDGCSSWSSAVVPPSASVIDEIVNVGNNIFLASGEDTSSFGAVWRSVDNGVSWTKTQSMSPNGRVISLDYEGSAFVVAGSELNGEIYYSSDLGASFSIIDNLTLQSVNSISEFNDSWFVGTGNNGEVYELSPLPKVDILSVLSFCGEYVDFNNDDVLDLVGWKMNDSNSSVLWSVYKNIGSNSYPVFDRVYDFTDSVRGSVDNGGDCVATVDIEGDGDLDFLVYDLRADSSTNLTEDTKTKTGNKGFFKNFGTAEDIQLVLDDTLITPYFDLSIPFDGRFVSCSEAGNCGTAGIDYNSNYLPEGFPTSAKLLSDACDSCGTGYCDYNTGCYGSISYSSSSNKPYIQYEFLDVDNDGDFDLFAGIDNNYGNWYENIGTPYSPRFVPQYGWHPMAWTSRDGHYWIDFNGDTVPDRVGGVLGSPIQSNVNLLLDVGDFWVDNSTRDNVHNSSRDYTAPFTNDNTYEPVGYGYSVNVVWVGDVDGDSDADILTVENRASGNQLVFYESLGVGEILEHETVLIDECTYPCIVDESFEPYPDGFEINELPEWTCDSSVIVQDGTLVIKGSGSLTRCCIDLDSQITSVGTVDFYINPDSECKFSSYHNGFNELSVLNEWDNQTSDRVYNYLGNLLGKEYLRDFTPSFYQRWTGVYDINNKDLSLTLNADNFSLDFYDGSDLVYGVDKLCWNAETVESVCKLDDLLVYAGTDRIEDTTGDLVVNDSYECYAGFCYRTDDVLVDARPKGYQSQATFIGGAFFDYNRCIAEGYNPNQLCIIKLAWEDGTNTMKNWFIDNIVPIFIMILILVVLAITVLHNRNRG